MKNMKLLWLYLTFLLVYYIFVADIPFCSDKVLCLFEGNSFFSFSFNRNITMNMIMIGVINSIAITYISSLISELRKMDVYIRIRLNGRNQTRFYYSEIFNAMIVIMIPKFFIDLIMTGFNGLLLVLVIQISSLMTLLLYAGINLSFSFSGFKHKTILFLLITLNFVSSMVYTKLSIFSVLVFTPYTLYEFNISVLLIKLLFVLIGIIIFSTTKEKFANNLL